MIRIVAFSLAIVLLLPSNLPAKSRQSRYIYFAGLWWYVKQYTPKKPGDLFWSNSPESVWVDKQGRLHLRLREEKGIWHSVEVASIKKTGYGEHRFLVEGEIDRMDKNIVFGPFVWADNKTEIDIEYSRWGNKDRVNVGQFALPPYKKSNIHTFPSPLKAPFSTLYFDWQPDAIRFGAIQGHHYKKPPDKSDIIEQWTYRGPDIPLERKNLHIHIALFLKGVARPEDLSTLEVIVTDLVHPIGKSALRDVMRNK